jgi:non-homologous end joining protein Ku
MARLEEVNKYKSKFANYDYKKLESEAMKIAYGLIDERPNTWKEALKNNPKHIAITELIKEIKSNERQVH